MSLTTPGRTAKTTAGDEVHPGPAWRRLVVATDGSPGAAAAVARGVALAGELGAAVVFVTVRHPIRLIGDPYYQHVLTRQLRRASAILTDAAAVAAAGGVPSEAEILEGDPPAAILAAVAAHGAELVVVGSRGLGAIGGALLGSVSRALVEHSPVPVLVVRDGLERAAAA